MKKQFKTYYGGKGSSGTYQTIINLIRPHDYFFEPFGGNYTISRKIGGKAIRLINDLSIKTFEKYPPEKHSFWFYNFDYREFINKWFFDSGIFKNKVVIYFDPPYPLDSRKSQRLVYDCEMDLAAHVDFLNYVISQNFKCDILISTYPNQLYAEKLKDWYRIEFKSMTRKGLADEWLFLNYDPAKITELQDTSYFGADFTERQKNKRILDNNIRKFKNMNPIFRNEYFKRIQKIMTSGKE